MGKREFAMLAHTFDPNKVSPAGWLMSQKLDGMRCLWDAGISRGLHVRNVPYSNTDKDYRFINQNIIATGLWTRGGKVIQAPNWFLDLLPPFPLDGELYAGQNNFQLTMSIVKDIIPSEDDWKQIKYMVFDSPQHENMFADGVINFRTHKKSYLGVDGWAQLRAKDLGIIYPFHSNVVELVYKKLLRMGIENDHLEILNQEMLPFNTIEAMKRLEERLEQVTNAGGEGLILRKPHSFWVPERSHSLLKVKKWNDSEGTVIGYTWGRKTDKGSKLLGKMGALVVNWNGKIFELSGFTDEERRMVFKGSGNDAEGIGSLSPGKTVNTEMIHNRYFPLGSKITFRYRELTDSGIPKEGRYWRKGA